MPGVSIIDLVFLAASGRLIPIDSTTTGQSIISGYTQNAAKFRSRPRPCQASAETGCVEIRNLRVFQFSCSGVRCRDGCNQLRAAVNGVCSVGRRPRCCNLWGEPSLGSAFPRYAASLKGVEVAFGGVGRLFIRRGWHRRLWTCAWGLRVRGALSPVLRPEPSVPPAAAPLTSAISSFTMPFILLGLAGEFLAGRGRFLGVGGVGLGPPCPSAPRRCRPDRCRWSVPGLAALISVTQGH